jgi:hypothetical protein
MPTLYEQIKETEAKLNLEGDNDDGTTDNESGVREDRSVRGQGGSDKRTRSEQGESKDSGTGERGEDGTGGTSSSESGASQSDAGTRKRSGRKPRVDSKDAQEAGSATRQDGEAPREAGESSGDGRVRGRSGHDASEQDAVDEKPKAELTNADWARQRRELRELKAKLTKLESEKVAPVTAKEEPKKEEVKAAEPAKEPDKNENYQAWLEWKLQQQDNTIQEQAKLTKDYQDWKTAKTNEEQQSRLTDAAIEEFTRIEDAYKKDNPDYGDAMDFAREKYKDAAKIFYPDKTEKQIEEAIDKQMLAYAANYAAKGLNPAEELYDLVVERFGYKKGTVTDMEEDETKPSARTEPKKPNLRVIEGNRKRSATPLGTGGQSGSIPITKEIAADMSLGEFSRLTQEDLINLENMG